MDLPTPRPGPQQVLIEVHAAGVNFPDTLIIEGKYQYKPEFPFSPGGEVAGIVRAVGSEVSGLTPGDRVLAPVGWGGYAEMALAEAWRVVKIPDSMDFDTAASFILTYGTSHHALKDRAQLAPGETLLVLGAAGGVGLAAVEIGKAMGARVIAAASSEDKLQVCRQHGADACIDYRQENLRERLKELTDNRGVDVVYDPVGGDLCDPALRSMAWNGRLGRPLPDRRLRGRHHSRAAAQPALAQGLLAGRGVLGGFRAQAAAAQRGQSGGNVPVVPRGPAATPHLRALPAGARRRGDARAAQPRGEGKGRADRRAVGRAAGGG
jgi:NADPH:quinone reductase-like Zn-dependent oxidoreductase